MWSRNVKSFCSQELKMNYRESTGVFFRCAVEIWFSGLLTVSQEPEISCQECVPDRGMQHFPAFTRVSFYLLHLIWLWGDMVLDLRPILLLMELNIRQYLLSVCNSGYLRMETVLEVSWRHWWASYYLIPSRLFNTHGLVRLCQKLHGMQEPNTLKLGWISRIQYSNKKSHSWENDQAFLNVYQIPVPDCIYCINLAFESLIGYFIYFLTGNF